MRYNPADDQRVMIGGIDVGDTERFDAALLDMAAMSNEDLRALLDEFYQEEQRLSYRRRVLHGKIDILRAELVRRLKNQREAGEDVITGGDVERLIDILANDLRGVSRFDVASDTLEDDEDDD